MSVIKRRGTRKGHVGFTVRMTPEFKQKLDDAAYRDRKSLGLFVTEILEENLSERENAEGHPAH